MNILDRAVAWVSPEAGLRRVRARAASDLLARAYDAAKPGRRTDGWTDLTGGRSANAQIGPSLARMRENARDLVRNNAYGARAVEVLAGMIVGTGIIPQSRASSRPLARKIDKLWASWSAACDADWQLDFYGLQALITRTVIESGEALVRFRPRRIDDGLPLPLQLQVLEGDFLDSSKTANGGNIVVNGVEFDAIGRRVAYWLFSSHPDEAGIRRRSLTSSRVPASEVLHVYRKMRPGQVRGVPWFAPVLMRAYDLAGYEEAELLRKKIESCFVAFVTQPDGGGGPKIGVAEKQEAGRRIESFEPGMVEYLQPGEDVEFGAPSSSQGYRDYIGTQLHGFAAGVGTTYEQLTGDLSQVNYSSYRAGQLDQRTIVEQFRWLSLIPMLCVPVWGRFIGEAVIMGAIRQADEASEWMPPAFESIDPGKDAKADEMMMRNGTLTLPQAIARKGYDPEAQLEEIARFNKRMDELGITLDCDPRRGKSGAANGQDGSAGKPAGGSADADEAGGGKDD